MRDFIEKHIDDDTVELLLAAHRYPNVDIPAAVEQIEARKRLKTKLPEWFANYDLLMCGRVPAEQCSSEQTARYKQSIVAEAKSLCDMTGGMGVDFYYMTSGMERAIYTERQAALCDAARHNFHALSHQCEIRQGDGRDLPIPDVDVIYLDPARRAADGSRVYAIEDCEPNVIEWQEELLSHAGTLLVKLSPMIDITDAIRKMSRVTDVYVIAVRNECKEVLIKCESAISTSEAVTFHCVDFLATHTLEYTFLSTDESSVEVSHDASPLYIYEPDVTLMKVQAFGSLCSRYGVRQLDFNTRLMTSASLIVDFPGRAFVVEELIPFSSKHLKRLKSQMPKANIATRNFPLTADELRHRTGIKDGGDIYLFGTTLAGDQKVILKCRKA